MLSGTVWGAIDLLNSNNRRRTKDTFDDIEEWLDTIVRKTQKTIEEKNSFQKRNNHYELSNDDTTGFGGSETINSVKSPKIISDKKFKKINKKQTNKNKKLCKNKEVNKIKAGVKDKNTKSEQIFEDESLPDCFGPQIECSFNLPRVSAQLEKLMGTNVVRLTDRKYMQELRERIQKDYNETLQKRIDQRQASEMERERNLLMEGKGDKIQKNLYIHPVFIVNQHTNNVGSRTRAKLKTNREKTAERLIKLGSKWEKERLIYAEFERQQQLEMKKRREEALLMQHDYEYTNSNKDQESQCAIEQKNSSEEKQSQSKIVINLVNDDNVNDYKKIPGITEQATDDDNSSLATSEINFDFKEFIDKSEISEFTPIVCQEGTEFKITESSKYSKKSKVETETLISEDKPKEIIYSESELFGEIDIQKLNRRIELSIDDDFDDIFDEEEIPIYPEIKKKNNIPIFDQTEFDLFHYEDPMILKLKETDNVIDLYGLADEIIGGTVNVDTDIEKK